MRKSILIVAAVAALLVPLAALAVTTPASVASQICKQEQLAQQGTNTFNLTYGTNASRSNAFGKCVAKNASNAQHDVTSANTQCKALQADKAGFAAAHNGLTFDQVYGTNNAKGQGAHENAFGKCVSTIAHQLAGAQVKSETAAAKTCKASLKADPKAFATKYGAGRSALGKCVSATSKSK